MNNAQKIDYIRRHLPKALVFIGMMGAGKTTQGRKIAEILGFEFFDSDIEIEADENRLVKDIFKQNGEAHFRHLEKTKIAEILNRGRSVISVGGGAVTSPETLSSILSNAICLWVDAPVEVLAARTAGTGTRPLLNGSNPEEALTERMVQRRHLYGQAHIRIDGSDSPDEVSAIAVGQIYDYLLKEKQ